MNLFGNSLKFTSVSFFYCCSSSDMNFCSTKDGFVHVMLRQLPSTSDTPRNKVRIELSVIDTGKVRSTCEWLTRTPLTSLI